MKNALEKYSASGSMLGYLYQVRIALLWAAKQSSVGNFTISVETLDDVSFTDDKDATVVLQTKHSINSQATLSDLSACPNITVTTFRLTGGWCNSIRHGSWLFGC